MKKNVFFVVSFFLILAIMAGMTLFLPAREMSESEKRPLAQMPVLNGDTVLSGEFQEGLADFLSDQVPGRDRWIALNTGLKKLLGQKKINGVYLGEDGYYFQAFTDSDYSETRKNAGFALFDEFAAETGTSVKIMMVPTPADVLAEKLPANAPMYNADKLWSDLMAAAPGCQVIDLRQRFAHAAKDTQLYYRTDHHWTTQGAYLAYVAYCEAMGVEAKTMEHFALEQVSDGFYGTIYSKVLDSAAKPDSVYAATNLPKVTVTIDDKQVVDSVYFADRLEQKDKYEYFFGGNYGKVEITTDANNGKTLLIVKDSFANSMVPYLLEDYERIVMLDMRFFGGKTRDVVTQYGVTDVLVLYEMTNLLTTMGDFGKILK
jgi:hypothetical protein